VQQNVAIGQWRFPRAFGPGQKAIKSQWATLKMSMRAQHFLQLIYLLHWGRRTRGALAIRDDCISGGLSRESSRYWVLGSLRQCVYLGVACVCRSRFEGIFYIRLSLVYVKIMCNIRGCSWGNCNISSDKPGRPGPLSTYSSSQ